MINVSRAEALAVCYTCRLRHPCFSDQGYLDFVHRHQGHATSYLNREALAAKGADRLAAWDPRKVVRAAFGPLAVWLLRQAVGELGPLASLAPNADIKQAFQSAQALVVTNLNSLASSATAGWQSAVVDNASNLYLDDLFQLVLDFANTSPANSKACYLFAYHALETTYTNPCTGAEGTLTLLDVTANAQAMPLLGMLPYTTADEIAESRVMSMAATAGGLLPPKYGVAVINHTGAAIAASGNTFKHSGVFATVI